MSREKNVPWWVWRTVKGELVLPPVLVHAPTEEAAMKKVRGAKSARRSRTRAEWEEYDRTQPERKPKRTRGRA